MKHYIIIKFLDKNILDDIFDDIKNTLNEVTKIEGISSINYHKNIIDRDNRYDLMIEINMLKESLELYDKSKSHLEFKEKFHKYFEKKAIIDVE